MRVTYGPKRKDGSKPFYYTCAMKNNSGGTRCDSKNINGELLEEKLINFLKNHAEETLLSQLKDLLNNTQSISIDPSKIDNELNKSNAAIGKLLNKLKLIDDEDVSKIILDEISKEKNTIAELNKKKAELLNDSVDLSLSEAEVVNAISEIKNYLKSFDTLTLEDKQKEIKKFIKTISITEDGKYKIDFNIKKN